MSNRIVLRVQDYSFCYIDEKIVLDNLTFTAFEGECIAIAGPSPSGKSTLAMSLNGLIPNFIKGKTKGEIQACGLDVKNHPVYELSQKVGLVLQDPDTQLIEMRLEDEIALSMENLNVSREVIEKRLESVLELTDIRHLKGRNPLFFSGGEKQRVAIASILTLNPSIIVFDEPINDIDPIGREYVLALIRELNRKQNSTIIFLDRRLDIILNLAHRVIILNNGKIEMNGGAREVLSEAELLYRLGVKLPQVTTLCYQISKNMGVDDPVLPINVDEAVDILKNSVNEYRGVMIKPNSKKSKVVEVREVTFFYEQGGIQALSNVNLDIYEGEIIAILGQNGSGKTTLIKHFNGLFKPHSGHVKIFGKDTKKMKVADLSKEVGFLFQNPSLQISCETVFDEIAFGLRNLMIPLPIIDQRVKQVADIFDLTEKLLTSPDDLSLGEKQRVVIASIVAMDNKIIVLDEPTKALDDKGVRSFIELMIKLNAMGKTLVFVTHDMEFAAEFATRCLVMDAGKIVMDGVPREVFSRVDELGSLHLKLPEVSLLSYRLSLPIYLTPREFLSNVSLKKNVQRLLR